MELTCIRGPSARRVCWNTTWRRGVGGRYDGRHGSANPSCVSVWIRRRTGSESRRDGRHDAAIIVLTVHISSAPCPIFGSRDKLT